MSEEKAIHQQNAESWGRAAATYSLVGPPFFQHFGRELVKVAGIRPGDKVLDVAAGRGAVLFPAIDMVGPSGDVVGVDFSQGMVQETTTEIKARGLTNARMIQMDAEQLEFPVRLCALRLCDLLLSAPRPGSHRVPACTPARRHHVC